MALNDMEHEYETAYIKAALIRSHHLEPHTSFSLFLRAICTFSGREYKYDPAQRVDTVIYHDEKKFMKSKSSKWQRGRRIVSYLTEGVEANLAEVLIVSEDGPVVADALRQITLVVKR